VSETRGGNDWPQPEVYSAAGLLQAGAPEDRLLEQRRAMTYLSRSWASRAITSVDFNAK
jgi:hypothetical protein